jgi:tetratricopeptide (TPR) repeat protein
VSNYQLAVQERVRRAELERTAAEARADEARVRALAERKARWLTTGLAVLGLLFFFVVGFAAWYWQQQRVALQAETTQLVENELQPTRSLVRSGWKQARQPEHWRVTLESAKDRLKQAETLVASRESTPELIDRVGTARKELDEAFRALQLAEEIDGCLEGILRSGSTGQSYADAARSLREIFKRRGVDVLDPDSDRIADWVNYHGVRDSLLVILAAWSYWERDSQIKERLVHLLNKIDPDKIASGIRWLLALKLKNHAELEVLAQGPDAMKMPPKALVLMGIALRWTGNNDVAVKMLKQWQARYPDEFWLSLQLGYELLGLKEPRPIEAIQYMSVAVALRKEYWRAHFGLGDALHKAGELHAAFDAYEKALECGLKQAGPDSAKWLPEVLELWSKLGVDTNQTDRIQVAIERWRADPNLSSVRDPVALSRLAGDEKKAWTQFWTEVGELLKRTHAKE